MKKIIGALIVLLSITLIGLVILRIWDIHIVSLETVVHSGMTFVLLGVFILILIVVYGAFFRNNEQGYNNRSGNRAHPKL